MDPKRLAPGGQLCGKARKRNGRKKKKKKVPNCLGKEEAKAAHTAQGIVWGLHI